MRKSVLAALVAGTVTLSGSAAALATPSPTAGPNNPGQPGAQLSGGTTCGSDGATNTPGQSGSTSNMGSPFAPGGTSGNNYAGNGANSVNNTSSPSTAISQYDISCFQVTSNPGH